MLAWIWAGAFLVAGVCAIARSVYVEYIWTEDDIVGRFLMIVMGVCLILLSALTPSDACVIPLLRWFSRVLPEPESGFHLAAGVLTGAVVLAYVIAVVAVTILAVRRWCERRGRFAPFDSCAR